MVNVVGSEFHGAGQEGDFGWMIGQPEYAAAFFIFNDNESQWQAHRTDPFGGHGCAAGGGNAVIRPHQCETPPRALGVPTGDGGVGYVALTDDVKKVVDDALTSIAHTVNDNGYNTIYYSSDGHGGLGTGIFSVGEDVKAYIVRGIEALGTRV